MKETPLPFVSIPHLHLISFQKEIKDSALPFASPLLPFIQDDVKDVYKKIITDTIKPWDKFACKTITDITIKKFDGNFISFDTSKDSGHAVLLVWNEVLDDHIKKGSRELIESIRLKAIERNISIEDALYDCLLCLIVMIRHIFNITANIERIIAKNRNFNPFKSENPFFQPDTFINSKRINNRINNMFKYLREFVFAEVGCLQQQRINDKLIKSYLKKTINKQKKRKKSFLSEYCLILTGDYWKVAFKKEKAFLKNLQRIRYIIHLLDNPNRNFYPIELVHLVKGNQIKSDPNYSKMSKEQIEKEGMSIITSSTNKISGKDRKKYEDAAYIIWEEFLKVKQGGDIEFIEKIQEKWEKVKKAYNQEGIIISIINNKNLKFIYKYRLDSNAENARTNIKKQINKAIKDLKEKKMLSFSEYIKKYIKTGNQYCYNPPEESEINWVIKWNK